MMIVTMGTVKISKKLQEISQKIQEISKKSPPFSLCCVLRALVPVGVLYLIAHGTTFFEENYVIGFNENNIEEEI